MTIITRLTPAAFLAQVRKQAAQSPRHVPNALMDGAAGILSAWIVDMGYDDDTAAFVAGGTIDRFARTGKVYADCQPVIDAARQFGADCATAGYSAAYASRNFGAVIAYAATGAAQVEF